MSRADAAFRIAKRHWYFVPEVLIVLLMIAWLMAGAAPRANIEEANKSRASLGCKYIVLAVEAYNTNASNKDARPPDTLTDLLQPPFGGPSFLRNGEADLIDPWGKPYQMEKHKRTDGTEWCFIFTAAPCATRISQFGIGPASEPPADWKKAVK